MDFSHPMHLSAYSYSEENVDREAYKPQLDTQDQDLINRLPLSSQIHEIPRANVNLAP
jgi:hypothetical protein